MQQDIVPTINNENKETTLTSPEQIKGFFENAGKLTDKVKNIDNLSVIQTLNSAVSQLIEKQLQNYFYVKTNSPLLMAIEYQTFFLRLIEDATLIDSCQFCQRALERTKILKSSALQGCLQTTLSTTLDTRRDEFQRKYEAHRRSHIEQREDTSVKGLTFVAYGVYLNVISNMVPGVSIHIPGYALTLSVLGVIANHLTTNYKDYAENMDGIYHVTDRVISNSGLRYCWDTLFKLTERISTGVAHRVNKYMDDHPNQDLSLPTTHTNVKRLT